ncbi:MAG TPA: magnesium-translocating P-type ATPase [Steroidobacter sp.]|nr:magnesium-translocating P-type ATPase [Steroidobacter sp.]
MLQIERESTSRMAGQRAPARHGGRWLSLLAGAALVLAVSIAALHFSEAQEIARLAERAQPWWLLLAIVLQLGTYIAQGEIWRSIGKRAGFPLSPGAVFRLSLAKLFVDQALPSAGISGTAAVAKHLEQCGMPRPAVMAGVVANLTSYFTCYVVLLILSLLLLPLSGRTGKAVMLAAAAFVACSVALVVTLLVLPGRMSGVVGRLPRIRALEGLASSFQEADIALVRRPPVFLLACGCQAAIVLLDASTVWVLVKALGAAPRLAAVFSSFMISNLFRTLGVLPGGLGAFEASSVLTLGFVGVPLPAALSATLLFRGLSFWLPMLPGAWLSRQLFGAHPRTDVQASIEGYWALAPEEAMRRLDSTPQGLTSAQAAERLRTFGSNEIRAERELSRVQIFARQFASPLLLLLVFAAIVAAATGEIADAAIVFTILFTSTLIGYSREYSAHAAAVALRERIKTRTKALRDGGEQILPTDEIVPGDVVLLSAGSLVPADALVLEAADCYVSESVLTGESFPVEKAPGVLAANTPLSRRTNCVLLGTNVRSGVVRALVVATGPAAQFGTIAQRLTLRPPQTEFDRGIRRFGYLLTSAMLVMVLLVFAAHMFGGRPVVDTLLFSVALAVGLSPELLPAILSVNLARGAEMMARRGVLVRHLNAIENLGSMDVLCTDKTGTLTEGVISLEGAYDHAGAPSSAVVELAAINAALETGLASPLDDAILANRKPDLRRVRKLAEIPFDFVRKRVSVVVDRENAVELISKGAFHHVLEACTVLSDGSALDENARVRLERRNDEWSSRGVRVLAVATRMLDKKDNYSRADERALTFVGFLTFLDRPKEGAPQALADLGKLGVSVKLITGDAMRVAQHVAELVGMKHEQVLTGAQLDELHDEALWREAERTDLFVEVDPNQKERIILSLRKMGHVVGFLGDGVNDAPAMHAADTSLSVEHAADVAREAADFVLLQRDLDVICRGVQEGRRTFANTLKYVLTTTSANLGNMASMAAASLFLPFLPLTAGQILLNNLLSDIPAAGIAEDSVDPEMVDRPRRWDIRFIGRFMVEFGLLSSMFDFLTFGALLWIFNALPEVFRTAWFVESLLTELAIALVVRTRRPFFRSRPGGLLLASTIVLFVATPTIPYLPYVTALGFVPIPWMLTAALFAITALYVLAAETTKRWFYRVND